MCCTGKPWQYCATAATRVICVHQDIQQALETLQADILVQELQKHREVQTTADQKQSHLDAAFPLSAAKVQLEAPAQ